MHLDNLAEILMFKRCGIVSPPNATSVGQCEPPAIRQVAIGAIRWPIEGWYLYKELTAGNWHLHICIFDYHEQCRQNINYIYCNV